MLQIYFNWMYNPSICTGSIPISFRSPICFIRLVEKSLLASTRMKNYICELIMIKILDLEKVISFNNFGLTFNLREN